jgi:hypothetical protein
VEAWTTTISMDMDFLASDLSSSMGTEANGRLRWRVEGLAGSPSGAWKRVQDWNDLKLHRSTDLGPRHKFW